MRKLTLNIGKLSDDSLWLCLADSDTTDIYPLAEFTTPDCAEIFQEYMKTQGYDAVKLPTQEDIDTFLKE